MTIGRAGPIALKSCLRAATRLERYGFDKLMREVSDGSLSAIVTLAAENADRADVLNEVGSVPLGDFMPGAIEAGTKYLLRLTGFDEAVKPETSGDRMTFTEYHKHLYRIATGWLHWTPEQAWAASPAEILEAYAGHLEMLRAIHGGAEADKPRTEPDFGELDSNGLQSLKNMERAR